VKALVASWRSLSNTWQFSLQSHEARLTVGKAKILGVRLTKRFSKYLEIQMRHTHRFTSDLSSWSSCKCIRLTKGSYVRATKLHKKKHRVFILHTTSSSLQSGNTIFLEVTKYFTTFHIFCRSRTSSSSTTWVYARLQVPEHRLGGYSHRERWSRTRWRFTSRRSSMKSEEENFESIVGGKHQKINSTFHSHRRLKHLKMDEDLKFGDSTRVCDSSRVSGATDMDMPFRYPRISIPGPAH
jgi:hypothetical protein